MSGSWSALQGQWAATRQQWLDEVASHFERQWWQQLEDDVPRVLNAMAQLDEMLDRALDNSRG